MRRLISSSAGQIRLIAPSSFIDMPRPSSNSITRTCLPNVTHSISSTAARTAPSTMMLSSIGITQGVIWNMRYELLPAPAWKWSARSAGRDKQRPPVKGIGPVRTSSERFGAAMSMSLREFMPPAREAAPVSSKAHSRRRSAGNAGAAVGKSKRGEEGGGREVVGMGMTVRLWDDDDGGWEGEGGERGGNGGRTRNSRGGGGGGGA